VDALRGQSFMQPELLKIKSIPFPMIFLIDSDERAILTKRWSHFPEQHGGLAKVDSGLDYAANFSSFTCVA